MHVLFTVHLSHPWKNNSTRILFYWEDGCILLLGLHGHQTDHPWPVLLVTYKQVSSLLDVSLIDWLQHQSSRPWAPHNQLLMTEGGFKKHPLHSRMFVRAAGCCFGLVESSGTSSLTGIRLNELALNIPYITASSLIQLVHVEQAVLFILRTKGII